MSGVRPKLLFGTLGLPVPGHGGGMQTVFLLIEGFISHGYDVSVAYLEPTPAKAELHRQAEQGLKAMGVSEVRCIRHPYDMHRQPTVDTGLWSKIRNRLVCNPAYYRPWSLVGDQARAVVAELRPDLCFLYGFEGVAAFMDVSDVPKVAGFGVMPYKLEATRNRIRWRTSLAAWVTSNLDFMIKRRLFHRNVADLLRSVRGTIAFAANERDECLRVAPDANVVYLPNLIPDEGNALNRLPPLAAPTEPYRMVVVGHLRGTATQSGHDFLVSQIVPALKRRGWFERMNLQVIGKFDPPAWLKQALDYPNVSFSGFVEDFPAAVYSAPVYLVCVPDDVGNRSRISSAWSLKCCVVTHASSVLGMPEIEHGVNALVGNSGEELAEMIIRACEDTGLSQSLREGGRLTYDRYYRPDVAFPPVEAFVRSHVGLEKAS